MNPEIEKKFFAHLDTEGQRQEEAKILATQAQRELEKNDADFKVKKEVTIKPALEELVKLFEMKGFVLRVFETEEEVNHNGGIREATIGLDTRGAFSKSSSGDMKPEFKLSFNKRSRKLSLYLTKLVQSGPGDGISLEDITADWIHKQFLDYVAPGKHKVKFGKIVG